MILRIRMLTEANCWLLDRKRNNLEAVVACGLFRSNHDVPWHSCCLRQPGPIKPSNGEFDSGSPARSQSEGIKGIQIHVSLLF